MAPKPKTLAILYWNANGGIKGKTPELLHLLQTYKIQVALINETHLHPNIKWAVPGYTVIRTDRPNSTPLCHGGGTAVLLKIGIQHHQVPMELTEKLEATAVQLMTSGKPLRVIALYHPPRGNLHTLDLSALFPDSTPTIAAGDINAKHPSWNSTVSNQRGDRLLEHSLAHNYTVAGPVDPTHYHFGNRINAEVLDVTLLRNVDLSYDLQTIQALTSDHDPVLIALGNTALNIQTKLYPDHHHADWPLFRDQISGSLSVPLPLMTSPTIIDAAIDHLVMTVTTAISQAVPTKPRMAPTYMDLPLGLKHSISLKNAARRHWQAFRTADLHAVYNRLTRELRRDIAAYRSHSWNIKLSTLTVRDHTIWPMAKALSKRGHPNPPLTTPTGQALSSEEKANALADHLERSFRPNPPGHNSPNIDEPVRSYFEQVTPPQCPITDLCTPAELITILKALKLRKAPGHDGISKRVIQELPPLAHMRLLSIINAALTSNYFPLSWKKARVIALLKPGKPPRDPSSYRPISLLNVWAKVFEKIILARLQSHVDANKLIPDVQYGFVKHTSTEHQLLRLSNKITRGFNTRCGTAVVFLDIARAFDTVWHEGLLLKLDRMKFPSHLQYLIKSFLTDRSFEVTWLGAMSTPRNILAGVPQGSVLSPLLFNLFTADLPSLPRGVDVHLFADDDALAVTSYSPKIAVNKLQTGLNIMSNWYSKWRSAINPLKSKAVFFTKRRNTQGLPYLNLAGLDLQWSSQAEYLGALMDSRLNWSGHIKKTYQKTVGKLASLRPIFASPHISIGDKLTVYKQIIRPSITYGCPVWSGVPLSNLASLQTLENKALRFISNSPRETPIHVLHDNMGIDSIPEHLCAISRRFYKALTEQTNVTVSAQLDFMPLLNDKHRRPIAAFRTPSALPPAHLKRKRPPLDADGLKLPAKKRRVARD